MTFREPPAAESGTQYKTVDERCQACEIKGGDEPPCQPPHLLTLELQNFGKPCPRRELRPEDAPTAELFWLAMDPRLKHLWSETFSVLLESASKRERLSVIRRIRRAAADEGIREYLPAPLEKTLPEMLAAVMATRGVT